VETPVSPPLPCLPNYPPLPTPAADSCVDTAQNVTVQPGQTQALAAGCYKDVRVNVGGTLNLNGAHNIRSVLLKNGASLNGPAVVNLKGNFHTEANANVNGIQLNIAKVSTAPLVVIGPKNTILNSVLNAPFARIHLHTGAGLGNTEVLVESAGNTLDGNRVDNNGGAGIHVAGSAGNTKLKSNQSGDVENGGAEYRLDTNAVNLGGNRADGISIPSAQKCPTFPQAGICE